VKVWKFIFWVLAILTLFDFVSLPFSDNIEVYDFIGLTISTLFLVPYYGYAYQVAIGWKLLWQISLVVNVVLIGYGLQDPFVENVFYKPEIVDVVVILLLFSSIFVLLIPCYRYAFKSKELWCEGT
jgi:RsiW-degrading membrane proteinase PrsW (M82 family)